MLIKIGDFEYTEVWDGIFYKKLSNYPLVTNWEIRTIIEFIEYEKKYGRTCEIECDDKRTLCAILDALKQKERYLSVPRPKLLTECTACPHRRGCVTEYVCHTTSVENAIKIFACGKLLSARNARNVPVEELMREHRNAANDPADYFEYIMFAWGNCQAGDRLVMERALGRFPDERDLSVHFEPGVRFYFRYEQLIAHPNAEFDGVLPVKVKDELCLSDWVHKIVIPMKWQDTLAPCIPTNLKDKIIYIEQDCKDIWDWSEKVYTAIEECADKPPA
ncbi:MAG: phosphate ABC transporter ATPase [Clostridia bacterium]|nr:phosphate ABC transporter ATPase [Clostridia bacterium]